MCAVYVGESETANHLHLNQLFAEQIKVVNERWKDHVEIDRRWIFNVI